MKTNPLIRQGVFSCPQFSQRIQLSSFAQAATASYAYIGTANACAKERR